MAWVGGRCYDSAADSATAVWSAVLPAIQAGTPPTITTVEYTAGEWVIVTRHGESLSFVPAPQLALAPCDPSTLASDAVALSWAIVLVLVIGFGIAQLRRIIR